MMTNTNRNKLKQPLLLKPSDEQILETVRIYEKMERIYHYTSLESFYKILEGVKDDYFTFHAGSVYTMNDTQEMVLGYNNIMKYLPIVEKKLKVPKEERITEITNDNIKNELIKEKFGGWLINGDTTNFVVSFSASSDILPMWALYGGMGTGVCLEFSPYKIKEYYEQVCNEANLRIEHCCYSKEDIQRLLQEELTIEYNSFLKSHEKTERQDSLNKIKCLATMCSVTGAYIKHSGFEYEQEIRMNISRYKDVWKFAETRNCQRSVYVEVPIPINALTGIIIGPAANMNKVNNAMILVLRAKGLNIDPIQSDIPFRLY